MINSKVMIQTIVYSLIYVLGFNLFVASIDIFATGFAGIAQILVHISTKLGLGLDYSFFYLLLNIPVFILAYFKVNKRLAYLSLISVVTVSIGLRIVPVIKITDDMIINCIFGGIAMGYAIGSLLNIGSSSGGTDIIGLYFVRVFNQPFTKINNFITIVIILISIVIGSFEIALYTILSFMARTLTMKLLYTNQDTKTAWIVGEDLHLINDYINFELNRGTTVFHAQGGFTHKQKELIMVILNEYEIHKLSHYIDDNNIEVFININDTKEIKGNFKIDKARKKND
ncbi:MAG: YitT family protein [Mycoplasmatales bacterium]